MHVGLFFGSFNPIHRGHLEIAKYFISRGSALASFHDKLDEVWMVLSPQNPFKEIAGLAPVVHRQAMLDIALKAYNYPEIKPCYEELPLPQPTYTASTLELLNSKYNTYTFSLIVGADNARIISTWHRGEWIRSNYEVLIYPRVSSRKSAQDLNLETKKTNLQKVPLLEISASTIRERVASYYKNSDNKKTPEEFNSFFPEEVFLYLKEHRLYSN